MNSVTVPPTPPPKLSSGSTGAKGLNSVTVPPTPPPNDISCMNACRRVGSTALTIRFQSGAAAPASAVWIGQVMKFASAAGVISKPNEASCPRRSRARTFAGITPAAQIPTVAGCARIVSASACAVMFVKPGYWSSLVVSGPAPPRYESGSGWNVIRVGALTGLAGNRMPVAPFALVTTCAESPGKISAEFDGSVMVMSSPAKQYTSLANSAICASVPGRPPSPLLSSTKPTMLNALSLASGMLPSVTCLSRFSSLPRTEL